MSEILIPLEFALHRSSLNWVDLLWAYQRNLLTWKDLIQVAVTRVRSGSDDSLEVELSSVDKQNVWKVSELAQALGEKSRGSNEESKRKWLILCLAWAFENHEKLADPLGEVERIYADFDYPREIDSFVRFMPASDGYLPGEHSTQQNHQRLMTMWENYLKRNITV